MTDSQLLSLVARLRRTPGGLARFALLPAEVFSLRFGLSPLDARRLFDLIQKETTP